MAARRLFLVLSVALTFDVVLSYSRPLPRNDISFPSSNTRGSTSPHQVHISMVGEDKMRVSWITDEQTPTTVSYGTSRGEYPNSATDGTSSSYRYLMYKSGQIHNAVIGPLAPNTVYYYRCGSDSSPEFSFRTPPSHFPVNFAVAGDLGQTEWTNSTLQHIANSDYDVFLLPGDLSYADYYQHLWDNFGQLVSPLSSRRPWMVTQGNHELEQFPILHNQPCTAYNARWRMPFEQSSSDSNLYYSFDVAGVHVVMLGSYADFSAGSAQYVWLQSDLGRVDRTRTPWLVVLVHAPWYNTNFAHQGEKESVEMKKTMEGLLFRARVDLVLAGHVHAYERFTRVYDDEENSCGPVYITIGDGGNREGLATKYKEPQPSISIFREASFGHGRLEVVNGTHALWIWHRNDDDVSVASDSFWISSLASNPACNV